jgi:hypothetical protein
MLWNARARLQTTGASPVLDEQKGIDGILMFAPTCELVRLVLSR